MLSCAQSLYSWCECPICGREIYLIFNTSDLPCSIPFYCESCDQWFTAHLDETGDVLLIES